MRFPLLFVVGIGVFLSGSCSINDPVEREVKQLQESTTPSGGTTREVGALSRNGGDKSAQMSWQLDAPMTWATYRTWIAGRVPSYQLTRDDGELLVFSRQAEGDLFKLTLKRIGPTERKELSAQASFRATAF